MTFDDYFQRATGNAPFPYQRRLATSAIWPSLLEIPTGLGKTAAVTLAWLFRRRDPQRRAGTPRRLVYCLPMRVLVEQTVDAVGLWLDRLGLRGEVRLATLMGGQLDREWDIRAEDDAVLIGTQDMLLSRALNRGYALSRYRWPLQFGLLNTDCLWVIDEVQLVGAGLATTAQLQALRRRLGTDLPTRTTWMSATIDEDWLRTFDVAEPELAGRTGLDADDRADAIVKRRLTAAKACRRARASEDDLAGLAAEILEAHRPGTRTLVVVNTVQRAVGLYDAARKLRAAPTLDLLHSRFRLDDRARCLQTLLGAPGEAGVVCISTQVVEAGVDVSAATLFTDVAPWSSLVQRFGRCNRQGELEDADIIWIPLPEDEQGRKRLDGRPYALAELELAASVLAELDEAGPAVLPNVKLHLERGLVLRRRDVLDLFDTTP